jgi:iron complex outermembrane receptor protein
MSCKVILSWIAATCALLFCSEAHLLAAVDDEAVKGATDVANGVSAPPSASVEGLEEIVVTAQKRSENLQKVPIAVNVVSATELELAGVNSALDLGNAVPGLKLLEIAGQVSARIRGIGSTSIAPGQESPVAFVIDGIYYASSSDVGGEMPDVAQVSVLKGPQGTLFGRNATGGVIQITTRDPISHFESDVSTSLDNYLTSRSNIFVGGPLSSDVLASVSAQYVWQRDGWGTNIYDDTWVHRIDHDVAVRGKWIYTPSGDTELRVEADYSDRAGSTSGAFRPFPGFPQAYASPISTNPWGVNSYIDPRLSYSGGGLGISYSKDLGFAKLTAVTGYRQSVQYSQFNPSVTTVPTLDLALNDFTKQFTEELQLVSPSDAKFTWATGVFYIFNDAGQPEPGEQINIREGPYRGSGPFSRITVLTDQHLNSPAVFGQGTYHFTDSLRLTVGARYTYEKKVLDGYEFGTLAAAPVNITLFPRSETDLVVEKPTWRLALDWDLAPGVLGYVSYNRGFKSGGFNVRDPTNPPYQPEKLDAYEVGVKSQFLDDRIRLNGSGFYYDYKNIQVARYVTNTIIYNGAGAELYGVDLDGEARLTSALRLNAGIEWLHNRFTDFPNAVTSSYVLTPTGADISLFTQSATGNVLPYSPSLTCTIGADYVVDTAAGPLTFNVTDSYSSKYFAEPDNILTQSAYHFLDLSLAWKIHERYAVRLFANNVLNEAVASQFATLPTGYLADYPNPPRTYGAKFEVTF